MKFFDLHCDTFMLLSESLKIGAKVSLAQNPFHISLEKAAGLDAYCQTFAMWSPVGMRSEDVYRNYKHTVELFRKELAENSDRITQCTTADDIENAVANNKIAAVLSIEGGRAAMGNLELLNDFYNDGVRIFSLAWNERNALADGITVKDDKGLTPLGRAFITEMDRLGMILDVSHLGDKGFWDVCETTDAPFSATHSNARALCSSPRNLTDEMITEIIRRGGLIGMNFSRDFLENKEEDACADSVVRHLDHILEMGGASVLAMGSDFDGTAVPKDIANIGGVGAVEAAMIKANYPAQLIDGIFWNNALSFLRKMV